MEELYKKVRISRVFTLTSFIALMVLFAAWYMVIHPLETGKSWVIWLLHALPLACFIPVLKSGYPRGHAWLCFVLLLYFCEAVLAAATSVETRSFGIAYSVLVMILFTAAMMYARWASKYQRLYGQMTDQEASN